MSGWEEDEWHRDYRRVSSPGYWYMPPDPYRGDRLAPGSYNTFGRYRSRSANGPNIHVHQVNDNRSPSPRPRGRSQVRPADDRLMDGIGEDFRRKRMELELLQEKIAKEEEEERMKLKYELQKKKDEEKRRVEEAELEDLKIKWRAEEERKKAAEKAAQQKAIDDWNKKKAEEEKEAKETRERVLRAEEQRKKDEKSEIERMKLVIALEEEKQKEREKEEHERWLLREKQKKEKEKAAKKAKDDELRNEMEKRLHKAGFQDNQIDAILDPKKAADLKPGQLPSNALQPIKTPTYIRVHKRYLDVETLKFYKLPYEYDLENPDYIIILAELDVAQTDVLFEHTRRRRQRGTEYLIERGRTDKPEYAWVRKKKSPSRSPARGDRRRGSGLGFLF